MISAILNELGRTTRSTEKLKILESNRNNMHLREFFRLALSPHINFYIRKVPSYTNKSSSVSLSMAMDSLDMLVQRNYTGNAAITFLINLLENMSFDDSEVLCRIIKKDPGCGVADSTVNKIWPGLIPEFPNLLASKFDIDKLKKFKWEDGIIVQKKSDGARAYVLIDHEGNVSVKSRNGKELHVNGVFDYVGSQIRGVVIDGELLVRTETGEESRQSGNGTVNKCNKGTASVKETESLFLTAWDIIPYEHFIPGGRYEVPYEIRYEKVCDYIRNFSPRNIEAIQSQVVGSFEDANAVYKQYVQNGFEGAIVKHPQMIWEDSRSKQQMKMKTVFDCDLECIGVTAHTKKPGQIGSLQFKSRDGILTVSAGSGLSDAQRIDYFNNPPLGKIFTLQYNQKIKNESGSWSLFLPVVIAERFDKNEADSFEDIQTL